jgi:16S rRNA (guanine(966)-N(2))-methyltransferase RsmD
MRIITGKYKGKTIKMPKGIRPTQNKVRKALFDILGDLEGLSFLELFAGSGAVGFEAVSLGVAGLTLVDYNRDCLLAIKKNIESLKLKACSFYPKEAAEAIKTLSKEAKKFDIIFMDPPYYQNKVPGLRFGLAATSDYDSLAKKTLQTLTRYDILAPNGFIVVQHFKKDNLPDTLGDLILFKQSKYGDTLLSFYRKK